MRRIIALVENIGSPDVFAHVSPGKNLASIVRNGLQMNPNQGNFSGRWQALDGVYVTRMPQILRDHISARAMENHFVIVLVELGGLAHIDEDAIDSILEQAATKVLRAAGMTMDDAVEIDPEDDLWASIVPIFRQALGPGQVEPGLLDEYVDAWVRDHVYGEDVDALWWPDAKEAIIQGFPKLSHPVWGSDYSYRVTQPIGFDGPNHIVAVIDVKNNKPRVVRGSVPLQASTLVKDLL
jgi:hypothetical protein